MFPNSSYSIVITCQVEFTVADLQKAQGLKLVYAADGQPIGIEDAKGNQYLPLVALEGNEGTGETLTTDKQFIEVLGLEPTFYLYTTGVSEPFTTEEE